MTAKPSWRLALLLVLASALPLPAQESGARDSAFALGLRAAERTLESGDLVRAEDQVRRLLERDQRSVDAWRLRARWAAAAQRLDLEVHARHQVLRLLTVQGADRAELAAARETLHALDPIAPDLERLKRDFTRKLWPIAERYEKQGRPHSAIRVLKQVLALDPENIEAQAAVERIAAAPDPSLAADAKPRDLFEDVTAEWIREHDAEHGTWETRAKLERDNYITYTDAGYEVLLRSAEAMEQMNAFYRQFFRHGTEEDGGSVPRIGLNIFKTREEYLEKGIGPPVEWSGGHFTGNFVETYVPAQGGFEAMVGTLFHEAAHQFVSLATTATGWLNEGLASFFEGTRILPNGTVIMNMPATHRLMPLAERMERGWMESAGDGLDPEDPSATPQTAPTFRIVLENEYAWGPPWYAPTWGVVYFLYNFQDPVDGRFVYRRAFQEFIDSSGGRSGEGAVENFEEVVLGNPMPPLDVERPEDEEPFVLPETVEELDAVWREWCLSLRDEVNGALELSRPYRRWGEYAVAAKQYEAAREHFEKGLVESPGDVDLLMAFADLLEERFDDADRAVKLVMEALHHLEASQPRDEEAIRDTERLLTRLDPKRKTLASIHDELAAAARALIARYEAAGQDAMVMDLAWRMGDRLDLPDLFGAYEAAVRRSGESIAIWQLAYDEESLEGWSTQGTAGAFSASGIFLEARFGEYEEGVYDYQFLTLDRLTAGDYSLEAKVAVDRGEVAFCGFVFGQKDATNFHGLLYMPGRVEAREGTANPDHVDLMSSLGGSSPKIWRHLPVAPPVRSSDTSSTTWRTLRLDVSGRVVDFFVDGELLGSHEFSSREVLRGRFGLVTGRGATRFRDVRFLAREPGDEAARIERELRMEALRGEEGEPVAGSYLGLVPPLPTVGRWAQGEPRSWEELGPVPQVLVFMSLAQNEIVPVDGWLRALAAHHEDLGLAVTCVFSPNDDARLDDFLSRVGLPGAVAVDARPDTGIGLSFERFFIDRFNLPRVLLLDVDGRVVWEGDPGVILGDGPVEGFETYLDDPLEELVSRRKLREAAAWTARWEQEGRPRLAEGDLPGALALLAEAEELDGALFPAVALARGQLRAVEAALDDLPGTASLLAEKGGAPALAPLLTWAEALGRAPERKALKSLSAALEHPDTRAWESAMRALARHEKRLKKPFGERGPQLLGDLEKLEGPLLEALVGDLRGALEDEEAFEALVAGAPGRPARWLAREHFGW
jgi:tetratricopeptide (TPR) repeat protein